MTSSTPPYELVRQAALDALASFTGVTDPNKPWWNLSMPKALDIMLPAALSNLAAVLRDEWPNGPEEFDDVWGNWLHLPVADDGSHAHG